MMTERDRNDRVGDLLRRGDPYHGQELSAVDRQRIRARMRETPVRSPWYGDLRLGVAASALAALGLAGWLGLVPTLSDPAPSRSVAPRSSGAQSPGAQSPGTQSPRTQSPGVPARAQYADPAATAAPVVAERAAPGELSLAAVDPPAIDDPVPPSADPEATPVAVAVGAVAATPDLPARPPRALRFTAPRGTRIIWTLDPNFEPAATPR